MADRTVSVRLQADVAGYTAAMRTASRSTSDFVTRNRAQLEQVGRGLLGIGTAALGGLGLATKAAIDWESAWAGVTKTVDGSAEQMSRLEDDLRQMATELPASHEEIAAVAEAAGQLGIQTDNVADFTRVMIDLGETTNLSAEQAATSLARFSNIMGTAESDVERLGSVLVDLGNNSETTEAEILEFSTRIAAAAKIAGLSESDVMGFSAALTSVGVRAEAGGTALSKTFISMRDAVLSGGDSLDTFAETAGMSADEFATAFREDPAEAIAAFIAGLGEMNEAGQSTTGVFEELGLADERLMRALLSTASAGDLLTDSLELGSRAWEDNTALTEEAQKRYETAAAQIEMAWNSIRDAAIEVGSVVAPVIADLVGFVGDLADAFSALPEGVDIAVAGVLGLVGLLGTAGGAFLLFAPRIVETKRAMETLGVTTGRTGRAVRGLGRAARAAGVVGALLLIAEGIRAVRDASKEAPPEIGETTQALLDLSEGTESEVIRNLQDLHAEIVEQRERLQEAKSSWVEYKDSFAGTELDDIVAGHEEFAAQINAVDEALAGMVKAGHIQEADESVHAFARALGLSEGEVDQLLSVLPLYQDALAETDADQRLAEGSASALTSEFDREEGAADRAREALSEYQNQLRAMTDPVFALMNAVEQVDAAQDEYNEAVDKYGKNSEEAQAASLRQAEAIAGLEQAAINGDLSFREFSNRLDDWVEMGHLTEDQAAGIRDRVGEARGEAESFRGEYPAEVRLDNYEQTLDRIEELARTRTVTIVGQVSVRPPSGGAVVSAYGGLITQSGVQRFPHGGMVDGPGGPRQDLVTARLSPGEFVVQAPAVSVLGVDAMRQINQGRLPRGGDGLTVNGPLIGELRALSDRFSLPQLQADLRFAGAA